MLQHKGACKHPQMDDNFNNFYAHLYDIVQFSLVVKFKFMVLQCSLHSQQHQLLQ